MSRSNFKTSEVLKFRNRDGRMSFDTMSMCPYDFDEKAELSLSRNASIKMTKVHTQSVLDNGKKKYFGTNKYQDKINKVIEEVTDKSTKINNDAADTWYVPEDFRRFGKDDV